MIERKKSIDEKEDSKEYGVLNYHVMDGMADWVRVVDLEGKVVFANSSMRKALGDDIVGNDCYKSYCRDAKCGFCITSRSIATGETVQKEEIISGSS